MGFALDAGRGVLNCGFEYSPLTAGVFGQVDSVGGRDEEKDKRENENAHAEDSQLK